MQASIKAMEDYDKFNSINDAAALLRAVRLISTQVASDMNVYDAYLESLKVYNTYYQGGTVDVATHLKNFKYHVDCVEHFGHGLFETSGLIDYEKKQDMQSGATIREDKDYKELVRHKLMATSFIKKSNMKRYSGLIDDLRDQHLFKKDVYPKTLQEAYTLLKGHSSAKTKINRTIPDRGVGSGQNTRRPIQSTPSTGNADITTGV